MQLLGQMCTCVWVQPACRFALVCRCAAASCWFFFSPALPSGGGESCSNCQLVYGLWPRLSSSGCTDSTHKQAHAVGHASTRERGRAETEMCLYELRSEPFAQMRINVKESEVRCWQAPESRLICGKACQTVSTCVLCRCRVWWHNMTHTRARTHTLNRRVHPRQTGPVKQTNSWKAENNVGQIQKTCSGQIHAEHAVVSPRLPVHTYRHDSNSMFDNGGGKDKCFYKPLSKMRKHNFRRSYSETLVLK